MSGFLCSMLGTTVTVSGRSAATVSVNGAAQIDTAQFKFGTSSILFDGTEDWLQIDNNPILSYRKYYIDFKKDFAKWKNRDVPNWFTISDDSSKHPQLMLL